MFWATTLGFDRVLAAAVDVPEAAVVLDVAVNEVHGQVLVVLRATVTGVRDHLFVLYALTLLERIEEVDERSAISSNVITSFFS